ncbi:MAG: hypothetical protein K2V38_00845, partial [Gemmataceae bacterium]|nr:hypothetical protein [Gemmataceae bacterium]
MPHLVRPALVAGALLCFAGLANAGPIRWGYRAETPDGTILAERRGLTELAWSDFFLPDPREFGRPVSDPKPSNNITSVIWRSSATVTILDEPSGQSGDLPIYRQFVQQFEIKADGSIEPIYEGEDGGPFWPNAGALVLGGNVYRMTTPGGEMMLRVEPGPPPAQT